MLKHDHEHVPYFPAKNCLRSSSAWYGSQFLSCTYCMVSRWNCTKLTGLTLPLSNFLLVLCGRILPDRFRAPDTCWKTTLKAVSIEPQFSQQFFMGCSIELTPELWHKFGNFLPYRFWEKRVRSLDLPPFLSVSVIITEPNSHGLHNLECIVTFLQNFSAIATS